MTPLTAEIKLGIAVILSVLLLGLMFAVHYYKSERDIVQEKFDGYKALIEAKGKQAEAEKLLKEQQDAKKIADAVTGRDDALKRMQLAQAAANARFRTVPRNPTAPTGSSQVCIGASAYNAAFQQFGADLTRFIQEAGGYAFEGDRSNLDAKALIQAWPGK